MKFEIFEIVREAAEKGHSLAFENPKSARLVRLAARSLGFQTEARIHNNLTVIEVKKI
jgi:hypothetical protein